MPTLKMYQTGSAFNVSRLFNPSTSQDAKDTMNAILEQHITAALSPYRAPPNSGRSGGEGRKETPRSTWAEDYGPRSQATAQAAVDATRLHPDSSRSDDSDSGDIRKDRMGNGSLPYHASLWRRVTTALCPGTMYLCVGVSFAVVLIWGL